MIVRRIPPHDDRQGALALFAGRQAGLSHSTRVAIRRAVDVLRLAPGDEVLAPAWNCGSELDPLLDAGLSVRLYPVAPDTGVDPDAVTRLIGPQTRAVYLTHYLGVLQPETAALRKLCDAYGLKLIEDCALSLLSGERPAEGRAGDVAVFCFHKFFRVIGGGALVINRGNADPHGFVRPAPFGTAARQILREMPVVGAALRRLRRTVFAPQLPPAAPDMSSDIPGHYYFDPDLRDRRIGGQTLRALRKISIADQIAVRLTNHGRFLDRLHGIPGIAPLFPTLPSGAVPLGMPVLVRAELRNRLAQVLAAEGIAATPWWSGQHRRLDFTGQSAALELKARVLFLPSHGDMTGEDIDRIAARLRLLV
jgi:perosamine synthetase